MDIKERIELVESRLRLRRYQLAELLGVTPEWLSRIVRKGAKSSDDLKLRIDQVLRDKNIEPSSFFNDPNQPLSLAEDSAPYGTPATIRREIERHNADLISAAGDDTTRLGWIRQQQLGHLAVPRHWKQNGPASQEEDEAARQARIDALKATMPRIDLSRSTAADDQQEAGQGS